MPTRDEFDDPEGFFSRLITVNGERAGAFFENRSLVMSALVFLIVVALSGVIWASYPAQNPLTREGGVPVIRADAQTYKYVPADRGGMAIAHRDSTIFDAMRDGDGNGKVENLLSDADETPIDRQELFAGLKTDLAGVVSDVSAAGDGTVQLARMGDYAQPRPMTQDERRAEAARRNREMLSQEAEPLPGAGDQGKRAGSSSVMNAEEVEPDLAPKAINNASGSENTAPDRADERAAAAAKQAAAEKAAADKAAKELAAAKKAAEKLAAKRTPEPQNPASIKPASGTPGGTSYVQVASVPDAGRIAGEWASVSGKLPMIQGMNYRTQRADLGAKGVYHRIQVGPMSKEAAVSLCDQIKARKPGGCLVVK